MVVHSDLSRIKTLLTEALTVLCKNGLKYRSELCIEGLLGITLDNQDILLVNINEKLVQTYDEVKNSRHGVSESQSHHSASDRTTSSVYQANYEEKEPSYRDNAPKTGEVFRGSVHCTSSFPSQNQPSPPCSKAESTQIYAHQNEDNVHFNTSRPIQNPVDLVIKHENLSDGEVGEEISEISRHFNISRPNRARYISGVPVPDNIQTVTEGEGNIPDETETQSYTPNENKMSDTDWSSGVAPFCSTSNFMNDPHFFTLSSAPLSQAFPLFSPSLINQYNIGIQIPSVDNQISPITPARNTILSGRNLVCQFCAKVVRTNQALRDHIATHEQRKRYQCQNCNLQFVHRSSLANHRRKCLPLVPSLHTQCFRPKEEKT